MLHLRALGLLDLHGADRHRRAARAGARLVGDERAPPAAARAAARAGRRRSRRRDHEPRARAREQGLTSTVTFPRGNLAPEGSVIKSTAIDPSVVDADGVYRKTGPARVFTREHDAIAAIKGQGDRPIRPGDMLVLIGRGPMGAGMEEIYQITSALQYLSFGKHVAVLTDARFSGVSTGACIGHVGPEALAGGPIGKLRDGDLIRIVVDRVKLEGSLDLVGAEGVEFGAEEGARVLRRPIAASPCSRPTPTCPTTPGSGRPCRASAAAPGAAASTTPTRSSPPCRPDSDGQARSSRTHLVRVRLIHSELVKESTGRSRIANSGILTV